MSSTPTETEIKLPLADREALVERAQNLGFTLRHPRTFESNVLYDTPDGELRSRGCLLRIRGFGQDRRITFKGPATAGRHKVREELETDIGDIAVLQQILSRIGLKASFRYEKYRTEYTDSRGVLTIDETPIGNYLELEGTPEWIDETARKLEYSEESYITKSYGRLYLEFAERNGLEPANMVFEQAPETADGKRP